MLKIATREDEDELLRVGILASVLYQPDLEVDTQKIMGMIELFLSEPNEKSIILMYMKGTKAIGVLGVRAEEALFHKGRMAQDLFYFIDPKNRSPKVFNALVDAAEFWCQKIGINRMILSCAESENSDRISQVYKRKGFRPLERFYLKEF